jgi:hypothetical protein
MMILKSVTFVFVCLIVIGCETGNSDQSGVAGSNQMVTEASENHNNSISANFTSENLRNYNLQQGNCDFMDRDLMSGACPQAVNVQQIQWEIQKTNENLQEMKADLARLEESEQGYVMQPYYRQNIIQQEEYIEKLEQKISY